MPTGPNPADFAVVRATNLAVVLRHVHTNAPCSRADIAATTGLNKATVSSLVADLIDRRLLRETGLTERRIGRPATMLVLDGEPYVALGIEVNTDYLALSAIDLGGARILSWRRSFDGLDSTAARAATAIAALARRAAARIDRQDRRIIGLTVGVPGLVTPAGVVANAPNLGWSDVDLAAALRSALGNPAYPVTVDNDANLGALAEYRYGAAAGHPDSAYLTGELGLGAGILVGGELVRGARGAAGEIGHVEVVVDGPLCACGRRGCLEAVAGTAAIVRRIDPDNTEEALRDLDPEVAEIARRARAGDKEVVAALTEIGGLLGRGVAVLANVLNPSLIVLGGHYVPLAEWLLPSAQAELNRRVLAPDAGGCRLAVSELAHSAAASGGAASVLDAVDYAKLSV